MNILPFAKKVRAISALVEGCSIRSTQRMCQVNRETIMNLGVSVGEACQRLHDALMRDLHVNLLELDEIWSFVGKKERRRTEKDPPEMGDQYTFLGIDGTKKTIISFVTGKRDGDSTEAFAQDLRGRIVNRPQISSDGFGCYPDAIRRAFGSDVAYAQQIKVYGITEVEERRYSPPKCIAVETRIISGRPDPDHICTSYVERQNLTVRMQIRRYTRLTNAFSKKLRNHAAATALYVAWYNFCRVHETLRATPAMAIGVADRVWSIAELIDAACSIAPPPPLPAPEQIAPPTRPRLTLLQGGVA